MNETIQRSAVLSKSALQAWKLVIIGFIMLILMIPVAWISTLIKERYERRDSVVTEIAEKWGSSQIVSGPFISVPYRVVINKTDVKGVSKQVDQKEYLHITPETLKVIGNIKSETHHRGIFKVSGYKADLNFNSEVIINPDDSSIPADAQLDWNKAVVSFDVKDQYGLKELSGTVNGKALLFTKSGGVIKVCTTMDKTEVSKYRNISFKEEQESKETDFKYEAKIPLDIREGNIQLSIHLIMTGTQKLNFLASAIQETIQLNGDWPSPSFVGNLLPESRTVNSKGFTATWHTNYLTTGNKQYWTSEETAIDLSNLGVNFLIMIDSYQQTTRALKYSILFLLLTFMTFFFAEIISKQRIHPIQYLMVGCSLIIFYLLLLSISEYLSFGWSYLIASIGVVLQISLYCFSILKTRKFPLQVGGLLTGLYVFLFFLLRLEDSAVLVGSISLFVLLGIAMYAIRNVNWYSQE